MKNKIILFDVDGTLFDSSSFLNDFYEKISNAFNLSSDDTQKIKRVYEEDKKEKGYFHPSTFLEKVIQSFPSINLQTLGKIFWNIDLFEKNVYKDTSVIKDLSNIAVVGIFSKGDDSFQKQKIFF